jgi:tetratricopeptide (TPR) repeat protein
MIGLAAILVRLIYLIEISGQPGFSMPTVDEQWHWQWAQEINEKSFWGTGSYFRGPLYPYFLAILYFITGASVFWAKAFQVLLCGGTAWFIFRLAEHLFDSKVAIGSGIVYAIYGTLVFYETMFLIPVLFLFLTVWGMYRLLAYQNNDSVRSWILTGFIFGLAALAQPNILLVTPLLAIWLFFIRRKSSATFLRSARSALWCLIGVGIALTPVVIRNAVVTGEFILISSQGGVNFYLGNNEYADGLTMIMPEVELDQSISWDMFVPVTNAIAEQETGREMNDSEISSFWTSKAVDFILSHPGHFFDLVWRKLVFLISGYENSDATDIYYQRSKSTVYALLLWDNFVSFPFGLLFPLFLVGAAVLHQEFKKLLPLYIFILAYTPSIILFLVTARHRLVLIPFLIVIAMAGVFHFLRNVKGYTFMNLAALLSLFVISIVILNQKYYGLGEANPFYIHYNNGLTFQKMEQYDKAETEYKLGDRVFPFSAALASNLAYVQYKLGKIDMADQNFARAIALKPQMAMSYNNLGLLVRDKGNLDSARILFTRAIEKYNPNASRPNEIGDYYLNLAATYEQIGTLDSADSCYRQAMAATPLYPDAFYKSALFYAGQKRFNASDSIFLAGMHLKRPDASEEYNWGMTYIEREMYTDGVSKMLRAIKKDENFYRAWYVIAAVYNRFGQPQDSVQYYLDKCLSIEPNFQPALDLKTGLKK